MNSHDLADYLTEIRKIVPRRSDEDEIYRIAWDHIMRMNDRTRALISAGYERTPSGWLWAKTDWHELPPEDQSIMRPVVRRWITAFADVNSRSVEDLLSMFERS